ncbi:MAG: glycosyltransferase family 2 protein [Candidatus Auribacter fodinae]|jgi:glycosyltransferase involved in cell wall biosynthesis|uniref:Glycosyltransferase family 2 protein n=1 Tax=Candidatus Auribacter fodinae TaxID=2093366 RepID=A0A3A4R290_9BACT|nr:MAG: glycosyltransferase family 2 protein [Candidatus Auribacter fodinae]
MNKTHMSIELSVIICTFNNSAMLMRCLNAISAQSMPASLYELLVVDNNSSDNTHHVVSEFSKVCPLNIRYVFEPRQGLSIARNRGIHESHGNIIVFADDDTVPHRLWLESIHTAFTAITPEPSAVGGRIVPLPERPIPDWFPDRAYSLLAVLDYGDNGRFLKDNELIYGCNMAFKRSVFDEFGLFDEKLGLQGNIKRWSEETQLIRQLKANDRKVYYSPQAEVQHTVIAEKLTFKYLIKRNYTQGITDARIDFNSDPASFLKTSLLDIFKKINYIVPRLLYRLFKKRTKNTVEIIRLYCYRLGYQLMSLNIKLFYRK